MLKSASNQSTIEDPSIPPCECVIKTTFLVAGGGESLADLGAAESDVSCFVVEVALNETFYEVEYESVCSLVVRLSWRVCGVQRRT